MAIGWILPAVAGVLAAFLFLAVAAGSAGALLLGYLAPLPLFATGLALGLGQAGLASAAATVAVALTGGTVSAVTFGVLFCVPVLILVDRALKGESPGGLVVWLFVIGGSAFTAVMLFLIGGDLGVEEKLQRGFARFAAELLGSQSARQLALVFDAMARYPAILVLSWLGMLAVNGIIAQGLLARFRRNLEQTPDMAAIELPRWLTWGTVGAGVAALVLEGWFALVGRNLLVIAGLAYFFAGLAVVHLACRRLRHRGVALGLFYGFVMLLGWPMLLVAVLGFAEQWMQVRRRLAGP